MDKKNVELFPSEALKIWRVGYRWEYSAVIQGEFSCVYLSSACSGAGLRTALLVIWDLLEKYSIFFFSEQKVKESNKAVLCTAPRGAAKDSGPHD